MRKLSAVILLVTAAFTSSCAPTRPAIKEVTLPPQRIAQNGYSLVPLDEAEWLIGYRDSEALVIGKQGSDPDENMIIRAFAKVLPPLQSDAEFIGFAKSVLIMEGAARHKVLSQETKFVKVRGQSCAKTDTVMEDHGAVKRSSRTDHMILEVFALLCKHPNQTTGILVAYSHRYYKGHKDKNSAIKAKILFDSIEFLDL